MENSSMKKLLISLLFLININVYSQLVTGQFLIGGLQEERACNTIQLADGDYLMYGSTKSYGAGGEDLLIIRFNPDFSIEWQKTIGGTGNEFMYDRETVVENSDGSLVFLGHVNNTTLNVGDDILLFKLSSVGNVLWSKKYGGTQQERGGVLKSTLDGGYIFSGSSDSYNTSSSTVIERDLLLVKVDSQGNVIWKRSIGTPLNNNSFSTNTATQIGNILVLTDSSYLVCGQIEGNVGGSTSESNSYIARINSLGNILWFKTYTSGSFDGWESFNSMIMSDVTTALVTGFTRNKKVFGGNSDGMIISININTGNLNWAKVYDTGNGIDFLLKIIKNNSNNYDVGTCLDGNGFGDFDIGILSIDSIGNVLSHRLFGTPSYEHSKLLQQTYDGGYLLSGIQGSGALSNMLIIKTNNQLFSSCNEGDYAIISSTITINPQNYNPTIVTLIDSSSVSLTSSPVSVNIDTLCIEVIPICNLSSNFSSTSTCLGDTTYFTDLSTDSIDNIIDWNWNFGDGTFLLGTQNPSHFYTSSGNFNVTLIVTNDTNCIDSITIPVTIYSTSTTTQNQSICQGDSLLIGGVFQTLAGTYSEILTSSAGCDSLVITDLIVDSVINLIISDDVYTSPCKSAELYVSGGSSYFWSPSNGLSCTNCSNPIASPFETTTYTVTDISSNCSKNNTVTVFVQGENEIFVPNVFTPNKNGQNDGFNIKASCIKSIHKLIYNRWGMVVFESNQLNEIWDGRTTSGIEVPDGTYFYIFEITFDINNQTDTKKVFKGTVTLLR